MPPTPPLLTTKDRALLCMTVLQGRSSSQAGLPFGWTLEPREGSTRALLEEMAELVTAQVRLCGWDPVKWDDVPKDGLGEQMFDICRKIDLLADSPEMAADLLCMAFRDPKLVIAVVAVVDTLPSLFILIPEV